MKTPVIIVRRSTERPEIEPTFGLRVTPSRDLGALARGWLNHSDLRHQALADLPSPFGDGTATHLITEALNQLTQPAVIAQARCQVTLQEIFDEVEHDSVPSSAPLEATRALAREIRERSARG